MSLPREPRQKMINMMYLVLTALLALNVSSEILNAFKTVNKSLEITNETVNTSTVNIIKSLEKKMEDPTSAERAAVWLPKARKVQEFSSALFVYVKELKDRILTEAGGSTTDPNKKFKESDLDITTRIMITKGEGKKLLALLAQYKKDVLGVDPSIDSMFKTSLPINLDKPPSSTKAGKTWEGAYFHMVPTVAGLTILSKFQNDVKTTENRVVQFCHNKVGEVNVVFDTYTAFAATDKSYVMPGDKMEVMAGVGAFSKAALPIININGQGVAIGTDGAAHLPVTASSSLGKHTIAVSIRYKDQQGRDQIATKNIEYTVGQSAASIALDKMNVLYIGVDNPVTISATGAGAEKLQVSISGGGGNLVSKGGGAYTARVNSVTDECWINVSVDGKPAGRSKFRVRTVPQAQAYVGGQPSGANVNAGAFRAQGGVGAGIKDFPFELQYNVVSFTLTVDTDEGDIVSVQSTTNAFAGAVRSAVDKHIKAGKLVTIDNIRVKGPDGRTTPAPSLIYYIK